jgi:hypothetical protein
LEWLTQHENDPEIDQPYMVRKADTIPKKELTAEEKAEKLAKRTALVKQRRQERERAEKAEEIRREKERRERGPKLDETQEKRESMMRKRENEKIKKEKEANWRILNELSLHLWPSDPSIKARVVASLGLLCASKLANIQVPFIFKALIDALSDLSQTHRAVIDRVTRGNNRQQHLGGALPRAGGGQSLPLLPLRGAHCLGGGIHVGVRRLLDWGLGASPPAETKKSL